MRQNLVGTVVLHRQWATMSTPCLKFKILERPSRFVLVPIRFEICDAHCRIPHWALHFVIIAIRAIFRHSPMPVSHRTVSDVQHVVERLGVWWKGR
ncbi:hypothetical protein K503DRAFT_78219 [Rhizopogon vinicolor AM-OR11-026]|uniref:Uncharacterized protein n=1 Tax=Rhizopogon vinicolor AM-OR11-026 TaxID=1314800 RepID=A0A1B7MG00_9AGAM|nr:hypothetical protein K503DRAFT_78219 [Rhizopogon vinicolor AM-OR11-026]